MVSYLRWTYRFVGFGDFWIAYNTVHFQVAVIDDTEHEHCYKLSVRLARSFPGAGSNLSLELPLKFLQLVA